MGRISNIFKFVLVFLTLGVVFQPRMGWSLDPSNEISRYVHRSWSVENGLPTNNIEGLIQTSDGYIWVGTAIGLFRFDGIRFHRFIDSNVPAVNTAMIDSFYEDRNHVLWFSASGEGLVRYANGEFEQFTTEHGLSDNNIEAIAEGKDGEIIAATLNAGISIFKNNRFDAFTEKDGLSNNAVHAVHVDKEGRIWAGTAAGLDVFNSKMEKIRTYTTLDGLPHQRVTALYRDSRDQLWVGTNKGLCFVEEQKIVVVNKVFDQPIRTVLEDSDGNLWVGLALRGGLYVRQNGVFKKFSNSDGHSDIKIRIVIEDLEKNIWVGTRAYGLKSFSDGYIDLFTKENGLASNSMMGLHESADGSVWIGTEDGFHKYKDGKLERFAVETSKGVKLASTIVETRSGDVWFGFLDGALVRYSDGEFKTFGEKEGFTDSQIRSLYEDKKGDLWIGTTTDGLFRMRGEEIKNFGPKDGLPSVRIISMEEDLQGNLWVAGHGGLAYIEDGKITTYRKADGLPSDLLMDVYADQDQNIWIGSYAGLVVYRNGKFSTIKTKDGLVNDTIYSVLEDNSGNIWASTNMGITRIPKRELLDFVDGNTTAVHPMNLGLEDGLKELEGCGGFQNSGIKTADGKLWFATEHGLAVVDPFKLVQKKDPPKVLIERVTIDGKEIKHGGELSSDTERLEFSWVGLCFTAPKKVQFKYKLLGFDSDWVHSGAQKVAQYTNLPPGKYEFMVVARNKDSIWSDRTASFEFSKEPKFTQTVWFYLLVVGSIMFLLGILYVARVKRVEQRRKAVERSNKILERTVTSRTQELNEVNEKLAGANESLRDLDKMKSRFFANISHDFKTPLTLILGPVDTMIGNEFGPELDSYSDQMNAIQQSGLTLLALINDLLDLSKLEEAAIRLKLIDIDVTKLLARIIDFARPLARRKKITIKLSSETDLHILADARRMERIFVNLIGNALKYTGSDGIVTVHVEEHDGFVQVSVSDNGVGIPAQELGHIFERFGRVHTPVMRQQEGSGIGLALAKELVELHMGKIEATSELGKGSTFTVSIPVNLEEVLPEGTQDRRRESHLVSVDRREAGGTPSDWSGQILKSKHYRFLEIENATRKEISHDEPDSKTLTVTKSARVLLVDDNPQVLSYLKRILKDKFDIWTAKDGEEGWELLLKHQHDLVVSDVMMPKVTGLELCYKIKNDPRTLDIPVILLSARDETEHRIDGQTVGADQYFTKPFEKRELRVAIGNLLQGRVRRREVGARRRTASLETLLGGIAHELHNACQQVQNSQVAICELAKRAANPDDSTPEDSSTDIGVKMVAMESISKRAVKRITTVVHALKQYTRNHMHLPWEDVDIDQLLEHEVSLITTADEKDVELKLTLESGATLHAPKEDFRQMILNLVENAVHAVDVGGKVEIETTSSSGEIKMTIADNGCGISPDKLEQIFDPFFSTREPGKGMGMGLALSKSLVTDLGGDIEAISNEGVGTKMSIRIPNTTVAQSNPPPSPASL